MIVSLKVSDETHQKYGEYDSDPSSAMEHTLERFKNVAPTDRVLLIEAETRRELEKLSGKQLESPEDLLKFLKFLITMKIGPIEIPLSEGQIKRLSAYAAHQKRDLTDYTKERVVEGVRGVLGV